ncbi:MAG: xylulokinase [Negativicutes bacterium]
MKYLLGVDFGGGSSKATLLAENGEIAATAAKEYSTNYPRAGWAEQDPDDSFDAMIQNTRAVIEKSGVAPGDIEALCLDGATHTSVLLDKNDNVIRPAIYWTDRRSVKQSDWLKKEKSALLLEKALNAPSPLWTLPQLIWVREEEPENFSKIHKILFIKDYVRYRLTGDFMTDEIEAMGSMLMDAPAGRWSEELCNLAGLDVSVLPGIVKSMQIVSPLLDKACRLTGLSKQTKVLAGATDTVMEVYASGAVREGQATVKLATAGRICAVTKHGIAHPLLVNYHHVVPGLWYPGTATKSCAASYRWYRDVLCEAEIRQAVEDGSDAFSLMDEAAASVPPGSDNLFFHPYLQGEITPYLDDDLRASFTGVCSSHTKGHFGRAVMEGVSYSLKECLNTMRSLGVTVDSAAVIGGGAKSPLWRQIAADVLGIRLTKAVNDDSSLGSAMLAGVATGIFSSFEDSVKKCVRSDAEIYPDPGNKEIYERGFSLYKEIHDALAPLYKKMAKL